jgi:hypothetical protein
MMRDLAAVCPGRLRGHHFHHAGAQQLDDVGVGREPWAQTLAVPLDGHQHRFFFMVLAMGAVTTYLP